ncbi:MAG: ATP-binding cassette domain-containing protein [Phycisphaerae bacterium]|jgi:putative ABC transport system ATP-binding protein|nr:ATP-binding cassette domain-containing protein [Phycisphaerae bacterium]
MLTTTDLRFRYPVRSATRERRGFELCTRPLTVAAGGSLALVGPSGCGKSTLLSLLSGERRPDAGEVRFGDQVLSSMSDAERRAFRMTTVGLVFQDFRLIESLTLLDNILLPCRLHPALPLNRQAIERARSLAAQLGIDGLLARRPDELSHGERQRGAVARALLARPKLLLADEPTGNLDPTGKQRLLSELFQLAREQQSIVVVATHDHALLPSFDAVIDFVRDFAS